MKEKMTPRLFMILTFLLACTTIWGQNELKERTITVTIEGTKADGKKVTRSIEKSGEEAENFDIEEYVKENTEGLVDSDVKINDSNNANRKGRMHPIHGKNYSNWSGKGNSQGFLGVTPYYNENENVSDSEGVSVKISSESAASKAGLKSGDVILSLKQTPVNTFQDISAVMKMTKPNDPIEVIYLRDGVRKTTTATLGEFKQQRNWQTHTEIKTKEKEACLGVFITNYGVSLQKGALISDFTPESAAREAAMQKGDVITAVNGMTTGTFDDVWNEVARRKPKESVYVTFLRDDKQMKIRATLKACDPRGSDESVVKVAKNTDSQEKIDLNAASKTLNLNALSVSPNPVQDMVNIAFQAEAVPTALTFVDLTGRVLFRQKLESFDGNYNQMFDLSDWAKGVVVLLITQGDKVFTEKIVVN